MTVVFDWVCGHIGIAYNSATTDWFIFWNSSQVLRYHIIRFNILLWMLYFYFRPMASRLRMRIRMRIVLMAFWSFDNVVIVTDLHDSHVHWFAQIRRCITLFSWFYVVHIIHIAIGVWKCTTFEFGIHLDWSIKITYIYLKVLLLPIKVFYYNTQKMSALNSTSQDPQS